MQEMSFIRTFNALLAQAGISQTEAALRAGMTQPTLSRLLTSKRGISAARVGQLLRVLPTEADRHHALSVFLRDQTPSDYREQLILSFGQLAERRTSVEDNLTRALRSLHAVAEHDRDLENMLLYLASQLTDGPLIEETRASYKPASVDSLIEAEVSRRENAGGNQIPGATSQTRPGSTSSEPTEAPK